jgi:hypothetical protein
MQHVWSLRREIDFSTWLLPPTIESTAESYAFSRWASGRLRRAALMALDGIDCCLSRFMQGAILGGKYDTL